MPLPPMPVPTPEPALTPRRPVRPENPSTAMVLHALAAATDRLLATIDAMPADAFAQPSTLPGWSRAQVLAHVALNSKALTGVLVTLGQEGALPMYGPGTRRDADIDRLAAQPAPRVADRVAVGASVLAAHLGGGPTPQDALESVGAAGRIAAGLREASPTAAAAPGAVSPGAVSPGAAAPRTVSPGAVSPAHGRAAAPGPQSEPAGVFARAATENALAIARWSASGTFERTPGGPVMQAAEIPCLRWREVEIHHADLALGYRAEDWPTEFAEYLLGVAAYDRDGETSMTLFPAGLRPLRLSAASASMSGRGSTVADAGADSASAAAPGGPEIHGSAADLAWWLIGRGSGEGLSVTRGDLPALGPWSRRD